MKYLSTISKVLLIIISTFTVFLFIYFGIKDGFLGRINILLYLLFLPIPKLINRIFKIEIKPHIEIIYYLYTMMASLLGGSMHFYRNILNYDAIVHFIWGFLIALVGLLILYQMGKYDEKNKFFNIMFFFSFSIMTSPMWETIEFISDRLFGTDMQRVGTGVVDTMKDMIVHLIGTLLFVIWYIIISNKDKVLMDKLKEGLFIKTSS